MGDKICSKCGASMPAASKFCTECGAPFPEPAANLAANPAVSPAAPERPEPEPPAPEKPAPEMPEPELPEFAPEAEKEREPASAPDAEQKPELNKESEPELPRPAQAKANWEPYVPSNGVNAAANAANAANTAVHTTNAAANTAANAAMHTANAAVHTANAAANSAVHAVGQNPAFHQPYQPPQQAPAAYPQQQTPAGYRQQTPNGYAQQAPNGYAQQGYPQQAPTAPAAPAAPAGYPPQTPPAGPSQAAPQSPPSFVVVDNPPAKNTGAHSGNTAAKAKKDTISIAGWVGILLIMLIPVVRFVVTLIWACGGCRKEAKRKFAIGACIVSLILLVLLVGGGVTLGILFQEQFAQIDIAQILNALLNPFDLEFVM